MLTAEQMEMRRTGMGGSEIGAVVGLNPYATPLDVYLAKVDGYEQPVSSAMERGIFLEAGVCAWYAHRTGAELREVGTIRHASRSIMLCTPDRLATKDGVTRDLSIKVPGPNVREQWGEVWTDEIPLAYLVQLQWEDNILLSLGHDVSPEMHLAAPINGDLAVYTIRRDVELQGVLVEAGERFWRDHVEKKVPPPLDGSDSATAWLARRFPRSRGAMVTATAQDEVLAAEFLEARTATDAAELRQELMAQRLKERIGDADGIETTVGKFTWRSNKNGVRSFNPPKRR